MFIHSEVLYVTALGLPCCVQAFLSWGKWGLLSGSGAVASLVEHRP